MTILYRIFSAVSYFIGWFSFFVLFKLFYRLKAYGLDNLPKAGGFILASNHQSHLDPPLIGSCIFPRQLKYTARDTLFKNPVIGFILESWGSFRIKRGTIDREAWEVFKNYAQKGYGVVFFPEGTRSGDGEIHDGKPGTGMLVCMARVPVVPVYINNSYAAFPRHKKFPRLFGVRITVTFGKPIYFDEYYGREENKQMYVEITGKIMSEIRKLKD
jgi:1-acyl-sn-glycerol-3-phosphate acyltransferase